MSYVSDQRRVAAAWKTNTSALPNAAKARAAYVDKDGRDDGRLLPFCLPRTYAGLNLLPEVRERALALFAELGIPWHAGVDGGPSNHLLSSQVQCVNALTQMVDDPDRIGLAFAGVVDIGEVEEIEPGRWLTFEYIGPTDYFGEAPGGERTRGAHCTSVDAAFRHVARDGRRELVLLEWKYTESYQTRSPDPARDAVRCRRYESAVADPNGPIRGEVLPFDNLLDEPFYQLVRQQLLAHQLETAGVADRVRVVHVLPSENTAYQRSIARAEQHAIGNTVSKIWGALMRRPDRFVSMSPSRFLSPHVTSAEYVLRYAPDVIWNQSGLLKALDARDAEGVGETLGWDGDTELLDDGVDLRMGTEGIGLQYPFRLRSLEGLVEELEAL